MDRGHKAGAITVHVMCFLKHVFFFFTLSNRLKKKRHAWDSSWLWACLSFSSSGSSASDGSLSPVWISEWGDVSQCADVYHLPWPPADPRRSPHSWGIPIPSRAVFTLPQIIHCSPQIHPCKLPMAPLHSFIWHGRGATPLARLPRAPLPRSPPLRGF